MAVIGLVDFDGKLPNLALMKLSAWYRLLGHQVVLNPPSPAGIDKTFVSLIFTKNRQKALLQYGGWPNVEFGGTGYSLEVELAPEVEAMRPDYELYYVQHIFEAIKRRPGKKESIWAKAEEIQASGLGFTTRGCIRRCPWCAVPKKEGELRQVATISDVINPKSRLITLLDNSLTADPLCLDKLAEIRERNLIVNISQGIDVRLVTDEIAEALSKVHHWSSLHFAWDLAETERSVFQGIEVLTQFVKKSSLMAYCLCGFNSTFEEDMYRIQRLAGQGIRPYVMLYQSLHQGPAPERSPYEMARLQHLKRWVNAPKGLFKTIPFEEYSNWVTAQEKLAGNGQLSLGLA